MYRLAVLGSDCAAAAMRLCCEHAGFADVTYVTDGAPWLLPALTLGANTTRILRALGLAEALATAAHAPDREQVRLARSGYLVAELPLGRFYADRYGSPIVNIEEGKLEDLLGGYPRSQGTVAELEHSHEVVVASARDVAATDAVSYRHAVLPVADTVSNANITWVATGQVAWQFSTPVATHVIFASPADRELDPADWHPSLAEALAGALPLPSPPAGPVREHWHEGRVVYVGQACSAPSPFFREAVACGLEDAWVLSRMLDNYEEDVQDALAEYQRYRAPRARRIALHANGLRSSFLNPAPLRRLRRNLGLALGTRFLPEIAMSKRDWFHSYDCVKGFR